VSKSIEMWPDAFVSWDDDEGGVVIHFPWTRDIVLPQAHAQALVDALMRVLPQPEPQAAR
jgi:hypothetical protein